MIMMRYVVMLFALGVLLPLPVPASGPSLGFAKMSESQIDAFLQRLAAAKSGMDECMSEVSEKFLGVSFAISPLGEGPGKLPDSDPLISFEAVDCTTFVEETLALTLSVNLKRAKDVLNRIRYRDGKVGYLQRKHFIMAQWIPLNQKAGFIEDVTHRVGGAAVRLVGKRLDAEVWNKRRRDRAWPLLGSDQVPGVESSLPVIPIELAPGVAERIPPGTILFVVRHDIENMPVRITHMGLVVNRRGKQFLRHASRVFGRVADERLDAFLGRNRAYAKWPVEGINLQQVKDKGVQK
ncbi:MAG TPA: N-acetylmuramoyl-L-alanine amidase-like domain-containing protein [Myxococcota bacterium]|nr:N-acetylmuramoyl-L-alanine amidase-like domain-containing protein [Myxococcota bacterium]